METKRKVEEAKRMSNFKWGQDFDGLYIPYISPATH